MTDVLIIEPLDLVYNGNFPMPRVLINGGIGGENLLTNDPREVWSDTVVGVTREIFIDLGPNTVFDAVYLGNTNAATGDVWSIDSGLSELGPGAQPLFLNNAMKLLSDDGFTYPRGDCAYVSDFPITGRFIRITMTRATGTPLQIGRLIIGRAFRPFYNRETGASRVPLDSGNRERASDGTLNTVSGSLISGFKWVFGDLSDAEIKTLWGIFRRRRTTEPLVLIENNGDTITDASVHYGTFVELEGYQRIDARKNRQALTFQDWI